MAAAARGKRTAMFLTESSTFSGREWLGPAYLTPIRPTRRATAVFNSGRGLASCETCWIRSPKSCQARDVGGSARSLTLTRLVSKPRREFRRAIRSDNSGLHRLHKL
jgi:hypothetical protein